MIWIPKHCILSTKCGILKELDTLICSDIGIICNNSYVVHKSYFDWMGLIRRKIHLFKTHPKKRPRYGY